MQVARVIGTIWATRKMSRLSGYKLMVVQPIDIANSCEFGAPIVAVDIIGAGVDETVITCAGSSARHLIGGENIAIDCAIIGIVDGCDMKNYAK